MTQPTDGKERRRLAVYHHERYPENAMIKVIKSGMPRPTPPPDFVRIDVIELRPGDVILSREQAGDLMRLLDRGHYGDAYEILESAMEASK